MRNDAGTEATRAMVRAELEQHEARKKTRKKRERAVKRPKQHVTKMLKKR